MKQIFDRIKRIIKAEFSNKSINNLDIDIDIDIDSDLKREFENLKENKNQSYQNFNKSPEINEIKAYQILKIPANATNEEIKNAYLARMKEYHPDKVAGLGDELKALAEQKTKEINEAYNFLRKLRGF